MAIKQMWVCDACYAALQEREKFGFAEYPIGGVFPHECGACGNNEAHSLIDYPLPIIEVKNERLQTHTT